MCSTQTLENIPNVTNVAISGISGRFPECDNIEEFKNKLFDGIDLVTENERRWPSKLYGLPTRMGKLKNLNHFDATFFGIHPKQANVMDPQLRILLEVTHEAILDAGFNPSELRRSRTGVFIGVTYYDSEEYTKRNPNEAIAYTPTGNSSSMFANRVSFSFDFKGPSYTINAAEASSMVAVQRGLDAIKSGECDAAIVGGCNICLMPGTSLLVHCFNLENNKGIYTKSDNIDNGYARSEAVSVIFLQKVNTARRIYATIMGAKVNTNGFKNPEMQKQLILELYRDININPSNVVYIESHGTGVKEEDRREFSSIETIFSSNCLEPLLVGSVKSNMGDSESASGICSIIKVIIAMETGIIPQNMLSHSSIIPDLSNGKLKVVNNNQPWNGGLVGINSFGFGGSNVHILLQSNLKSKSTKVSENIARLVLVSGRTQAAVKKLLDKIEENKHDVELLALLGDIHSQNITGHNYRGYSILEKSDKQEFSSPNKRPIWYIFSGMGSQWPCMGKQLLNLKEFKNSIKKSHDVLKPFGINLENILVNNDTNVCENIVYALTSIHAFQIALVDLLSALGIKCDGIVGHSFGEIGCAYADGSITSEQSITLVYLLGLILHDSKSCLGAMAAVGLSWEECKRRCPPGVQAACYNSEDNVTVAGDEAAVSNFVTKLKSEGIFAKIVQSSGRAFHTEKTATLEPELIKSLKYVIPNPKLRSEKWISSSIPQSEWGSHLAQFSSVEYLVNNVCSPVLFYEAIQQIPDNAIVIEIAPHPLLQPILKRSLKPNCINMSLSNTHEFNNIDYLLTAVGRLYIAGAQPQIKQLYPSISYPVSRGTPMISSMIEWDHSAEWNFPRFSEQQPTKHMVNIDISELPYQFISNHSVYGDIVFPVSGYLDLVWKAIAKSNTKDFNKVSVILENIEFHKTVVIPRNGCTQLIVNIFEGSGKFEITEKLSVVASGIIVIKNEVSKEFADFPSEWLKSKCLTHDDIYDEFYLRGYTYDKLFQGIICSNHNGTTGELKWENNWISFMDAMLQFSVLGLNTRETYLTTYLQKVVINPKLHVELLKVFRKVIIVLEFLVHADVKRCHEN